MASSGQGTRSECRALKLLGYSTDSMVCIVIVYVPMLMFDLLMQVLVFLVVRDERQLWITIIFFKVY